MGNSIPDNLMKRSSGHMHIFLVRQILPSQASSRRLSKGMTRNFDFSSRTKARNVGVAMQREPDHSGRGILTSAGARCNLANKSEYLGSWRTVSSKGSVFKPAKP